MPTLTQPDTESLDTDTSLLSEKGAGLGLQVLGYPEGSWVVTANVPAYFEVVGTAHEDSLSRYERVGQEIAKLLTGFEETKGARQCYPLFELESTRRPMAGLWMMELCEHLLSAVYSEWEPYPRSYEFSDESQWIDDELIEFYAPFEAEETESIRLSHVLESNLELSVRDFEEYED